MRMSKFEKKFGKYAIKNLSLMLILCYAFGYLIRLVNPEFLYYLTLNPYAIVHGQVWRLFTWIVIPPAENNLFFILLLLYFYYTIGNLLEAAWGTYRYNVYFFSGILFTILGSFLMMGYVYLFEPAYTSSIWVEDWFEVWSLFFSTYYINMSIFLAYAATFPSNVMLVFFILPVPASVLGIIYAILLGVDFVRGDFYIRFPIAASLLNFIVFFFFLRKRVRLTPKQMKHRQEFKKEVRKTNAVTRHKCAVCGQTEEDNENLEFRFCSKCNGNYEYCQEHLFTHTHVKS